MITHGELQKIAKTRLRDARILFGEKRYDSAAYLCGYSVELALKAVICKTLDLQGIPSTSDEFKKIIEALQKLKTHNLEQLLGLTNITLQQEVKQKLLLEWGDILNWDPEMRYAPIVGELMRQDAEKIIKASKKILKHLWSKI